MTGSAIWAAVASSAPLNLELNEITVLMAISSVGIIMVFSLSIYISAIAFFGKNPGGLS
jgi:hypothetical protein